MLTYNDIVDTTDLTEEEIAAIAESRHLPMAMACIEAYGLCETPEGCRTVIKEIMEDIANAEAHNNHKKLVDLHKALEHFTATHQYV